MLLIGYTLQEVMKGYATKYKTFMFYFTLLIFRKQMKWAAMSKKCCNYNSGSNYLIPLIL